MLIVGSAFYFDLIIKNINFGTVHIDLVVQFLKTKYETLKLQAIKHFR